MSGAGAAASVPRVPYDAEVVPGLERFRALSGPSLQARAIPFIRAAMARTAEERDLAALIGGRPLAVEDVEIPGDATGPATTASLVRPTAVPDGSPAVLHVHGGGMVLGDRLEDLDVLLELADRHRVPVLTIDYRLAPEHPYPAAADDALRSWTWLQGSAGSLGIDPARIVLSGASAGGGVAAGLALRLRDLGLPAPSALLLAAPMLDERNDSASSRAWAGTSAWDHHSNEVGWSALLGADRRDVPAYASPARAASLAGLPPVHLDVGSAEVFRDEVVDFARRIWAEGGAAELHVWAGAFHGFDRWAPEARVADAAAEARHRWLDRCLRAPAPAPAPAPA